MAQADKKHFGKGTQGKGSGAGAMPEADGTTVGDNQVLPTGTRSSIRRSAAKTVTRSKLNSSRIMRPSPALESYDTRTSKTGGIHLEGGSAIPPKLFFDNRFIS
jgi:hypothetical protein